MTADADADKPMPDRPAPLGWLYALVGTGVFSLGAVCGFVFFTGYRPLVLELHRANTACARAFPGQPDPKPDGDLAAQLGYLSCVEGAFRVQGFTMLAGVAALTFGFAVLLLAVPLIDRWRLRQRAPHLDLPAPAARFAELCDRHGLGSRRPRLLIAGPPVRQAFTTGLPFGRPTVVLPAAVAVAHADRRRFDPVVSHELAHVLARDVTWVSAVRGLLWLIVPAVTVSLTPELLAGGRTTVSVVVYLRALLLAAGTAALGALLLRLRERAADSYAARSGHADALVAQLSATALRGPARRLRLPALVATHPAPVDRIAAIRAPVPPPDGGFGQSAVIGAAAAVAGGASAALAHSLSLAADLSPVPALVTGVLIGFGLTPALRRRAAWARRSGRPAAWWRPVIGVAAGLAPGTFMLPTPSQFGSTDFPAATQDWWVGVGAALLLAAVGAGVVSLGVALARLLDWACPDRPDSDAPRPGPRWRAAVAATYAAVAATATAACWPLPSVASVLGHPAVIRNWLVYALPSRPWPLLALAAPVAAALLLRRARAPIPWWTGVAALVAGAGGGIAHDLFNPPVQLDQAVRVAQERWWICALAGWVALAVVALGRGPARLPTAVLVAWPVAALAGTAQVALDLLQGRPLEWVLIRTYLLTPLVWLVYLTILSAPVLAVLGHLRGRRATTGAEMSAARPVPARAPAAALVGSLALGIVVAGPGIPAAYAPAIVPLTPAPGATPALGATGTPVRPSGPATTDPDPVDPDATDLDPGRPLTAAEARAAAAAAATVLPPYWRSEPIESSAESQSSHTEPAACEPLADAEYLDPLRPSQRTEAAANFGTERVAGSVIASTISVSVTSYAERVPAEILASAEAARAACPRFSKRSAPDAKPVRFVVRSYPVPPLGEQSWAMTYDMSLGSGHQKITGTSVVAHVRSGHNLISVTLTAITEPVDEELFRAALRAAIRGLGSR